MHQASGFVYAGVGGLGVRPRQQKQVRAALEPGGGRSSGRATLPPITRT